MEETLLEKVLWKARWGMLIFAAIIIISGAAWALIWIWNGDTLNPFGYSEINDEIREKIRSIYAQLDFIGKIFLTSLLMLIVYAISWVIIIGVLSGQNSLGDF